MAESKIVQNLISELGQSQADRSPAALDRHFVDIDERDDRAVLEETAALAKLLRFYALNPRSPSGNWSEFFPEGEAAEAMLGRDDGAVPPHLGLFLTFLRLYRHPRAAINALTGEHLDFQFRRVLRFEPRPARPDRAHLLLALKKGAANALIAEGQAFAAGKDAAGVEQVYEAVRDTVIGAGQVAALHTIRVREGRVRFHPNADAPGMPGPEGAARPATAPVGLALAGPVLRLGQADRRIRVELGLGGLDPSRHDAGRLGAAFRAFLSGPKGWIGPLPVSAVIAGGRVAFTTRLGAEQPAVVDYQPGLHGQGFAAEAPVVQFLLQQDAALTYRDLDGLTLLDGRIEVEVDGLTALALEGDQGSLNPSRPSQPFGPQPTAGSRLRVGCDEALAKTLLGLTLRWTGQGAPANLAQWYAGYKNARRLADGLQATVTVLDGAGRTTARTVVDLLERDPNGLTTLRLAPTPSPRTALNESRRLQALRRSGTAVGRRLGDRRALEHPSADRPEADDPAAVPGTITITLAEDLLHADYRVEMVEHAFKQDKVVLNEPYTPTIRGVSLGYRAESGRVSFDADDLDGFASPDLQLFHVGPFGARREHAFLRHRLAYVADKTPRLLPAFPDEGELLIGLSGVGASDPVSLLAQVAEGSGDPDLPPPKVAWSVLADNHWRALGAGEPLLDTTRDLRGSGLVAIALPAETTTDNTFLPAGFTWLRAGVAANGASACRILLVANNAVEVRFRDLGNDPARPATGLPPGTITDLRPGLPAVQKVSQPFSTFGGQPAESADDLTRRAAERLRHRDRAVTPWDYERLLLEAFPEIHAVKCIPHASPTSWNAPGNLLLIAVPDLRNRNATDPLRPKVAVDVLARMAEYVERRCGMGVRVHLRNPRYHRVRLDFRVRFRPGVPFLWARQQLGDALVRFLTPWAFGEGSEPAFGGQVDRSALLAFVEGRDDVDFVTEFRLRDLDGPDPGADVATIRAETPDAILVSDAGHAIRDVNEP